MGGTWRMQAVAHNITSTELQNRIYYLSAFSDMHRNSNRKFLAKNVYDWLRSHSMDVSGRENSTKRSDEKLFIIRSFIGIGWSKISVCFISKPVTIVICFHLKHHRALANTIWHLLRIRISPLTSLLFSI